MINIEPGNVEVSIDGINIRVTPSEIEIDNNTLENLILIISELWPDDPSAPSVTLSFLKERNTWYGSICRYHEPWGKAKEIVAKVETEKYEDLARLLIKSFIYDFNLQDFKCVDSIEKLKRMI